jgi:hypothetical protein
MLSLLSLLAGCLPPSEATSYRLPFDGQTAIPDDYVLTVARQTTLPDDYPSDADQIQVWDWTENAPVEGDVAADDQVLTFTPAAPWAPEHDYSWTVRPPVPLARGPVLEVPASVLGPATFSTRAALDPVWGWRGANAGDACVLFSRAASPDELDAVTVTVGEATVTGGAYEVDMTDVERPPGDPGLTIACWRVSLADGDTLTVAVGDGRWVGAVQTQSAGDVLRGVRQWSG